MISRSRDAIKNSLICKGFKFDNNSDHMRFIYYTLDGKKTSINTKISRGVKYKILYEPLLLPMSRQCKLNKNDFLKLVDCPLSREDYEQKLRNTNEIR